MPCQPEERTKNEKVVHLIGDLVAGLAAPYSIISEATHGRPERVFGTGADAWVNLRAELNLFGYPPADEVAEKLWHALYDVPESQQRQDSLTDQLRDLVQVAHRMGCYDAADFLRQTADA